VTGEESVEPSSICFLCEGPRSGSDEEALILARGESAYVVLNKYPYNTGHVMVAPFEHGGDLESLHDVTNRELWSLTQTVLHALTDEYRPEGFNVGMNVGLSAGAGVPDHLHMHVVPRWAGDTNYMPITAGTKVLPETLEQTYARLHPRLSGATD
jgi:ATP adenylyltransferase